MKSCSFVPADMLGACGESNVFGMPGLTELTTRCQWTGVGSRNLASSIISGTPRPVSKVMAAWRIEDRQMRRSTRRKPADVASA